MNIRNTQLSLFDPAPSGGGKNIQRLELCPIIGKTNCLTTVAKDNLIMTVQQLNPNTENNSLQVKEATKKGYAIINNGDCVDMMHPNSKTRRGRRMSEKPHTLLTTNEFYRYCDGRIRRLTPTECARLQTVPDWYKWACSDTQQYKMLGNGWTVEAIVHILSFLHKI